MAGTSNQTFSQQPYAGGRSPIHCQWLGSCSPQRKRWPSAPSVRTPGHRKSQSLIPHHGRMTLLAAGAIVKRFGHAEIAVFVPSGWPRQQPGSIRRHRDPVGHVLTRIGDGTCRATHIFRLRGGVRPLDYRWPMATTTIHPPAGVRLIPCGCAPGASIPQRLPPEHNREAERRCPIPFW